jgi:hypothetical protein
MCRNMSLSGHKPIARRVMQGASFSIRRMLPERLVPPHRTSSAIPKMARNRTSYHFIRRTEQALLLRQTGARPQGPWTMYKEGNAIA